MGIEFPDAGYHIRQWRISRAESHGVWAARLAPDFHYCDVHTLIDILRHFEATDEWIAPRPDQSIFVFLRLLRETFGAHDHLKELAKIVVTRLSLYYADP